MVVLGDDGHRRCLQIAEHKLVVGSERGCNPTEEWGGNIPHPESHGDSPRTDHLEHDLHIGIVR